MSRETDNNKKVTVYIVHSIDENENEDIIPEDNNENDSDEDDDIPVKREYKTRKGIIPPVKKEKIPISKRFFINKGQTITDLKSLINAFDHPSADSKQKDLILSLRDLDSMIGMDKFKEQIINQILFFVQDLQDSQTFLHTVITGPPGTGKTKVINILAKIYCNLGILETDKVIKADRASLIGKWLGSTAIKTKEVLESARGGVLLLDEVYTLGNKENSDSFSKECIDTINQFLSEHVDELVCVIAGYKDLVQECFFASNPGLERRFPWRFIIEPYTHEELVKIMKLQLNLCGWKFHETVTDKHISNLIRINKNHFSGNGGDTKNLIDKCKIVNARRVFTQINNADNVVETPVKKMRKGRKMITPSPPPPVQIENTKIITSEDLDNGFRAFLDTKETENKKDIHMSMYI